MTHGHTLLELTLVLLVLSLFGSMGVGVSQRYADRLAVNQAREEAAALFHHARAHARMHGGARVEIDADGVLTLRRIPDEVVTRRDPSIDRVSVGIEGAREEAVVVFGPMGIGRASSLTLTFERGRASTALIVSSYGRLRREG